MSHNGFVPFATPVYASGLQVCNFIVRMRQHKSPVVSYHGPAISALHNACLITIAKSVHNHKELKLKVGDCGDYGVEGSHTNTVERVGKFIYKVCFHDKSQSAPTSQNTPPPYDDDDVPPAYSCFYK